MRINSRREYFVGLATAAAAFAQQAPRNSHTQNGIYYFSGTGSNDGYPKDDHVLVTDPFEKHVTRTMDALKKSIERAGCTMDSILHVEVFICLPHADNVPMPTGKAQVVNSPQTAGE